MSLAAGTRLGAYEIVALLGAGGMGEVYRAKDTRLDRTVAIKVLPQQFAADAEARARFEREGRAISSLDHPHICALYDVGEHDGTTFLVMQHLEGETLEARLQKRCAATRPGHADRHRDRRRARQSAPRRYRPSRSEAGQHHVDQVGCEAARLRPCQECRARRRHERPLDAADDAAESHRSGDDTRHVSVHGSGTDRRDWRPTRAQTSLRSARCCSK